MRAISTLRAIERTFEEAGLEFIPENGRAAGEAPAPVAR
jgi:hypothetical protein